MRDHVYQCSLQSDTGFLSTVFFANTVFLQADVGAQAVKQLEEHSEVRLGPSYPSLVDELPATVWHSQLMCPAELTRCGPPSS